jgi:hypothetical protein
MKKILILSGIPWNTTYQRHHQIANVLSNNNSKVYFIEHIPSSKFSLYKIRNLFLNFYHKNKVKVSIPINANIKIIKIHLLFPGTGLFYLWNKFAIKTFLKKNGSVFDVIINYLPINTTMYIMDKTIHNVIVYDCVRDFSNWIGYYKNVKRIEQQLCNIADLIFTDSFYLTNKMKRLVENENKVHQIFPTIDKNLLPYMNIFKKKHVTKIKSLAYIGTLSKHTDVELIVKISKLNFTINIYGIIDSSISHILHTNIVYKGFFNDTSILLQSVHKENDAVIIPYKGNMDGVIPAKLIISLITMLPVFINDFFDSRLLTELLFVYSSHEDLLEQLSFFDSKLFLKKIYSIQTFIKSNTNDNLEQSISSFI